MNTPELKLTHAADPDTESGRCSPATSDGRFCLLWTIGFSGKRFLSSNEDVIRKALKRAVDFLCAEAKQQDGQLTAVSSCARGGDVLFAETIRQPNECGLSVQWKCLLPFSREAFIEHDLATDANGLPLPADEREKRKARALSCLAESVPSAEVTSPDINPHDKNERDAAYLDCGYRTVDESDVLIILLRRGEIAALAVADQRFPDQAGTVAVARYALAARRPVILLPEDTPDPWEHKTILKGLTSLTAAFPWFVDPMITGVVRRAKKLGLPAKPEPFPTGFASDFRKSVWEIQQCLGHLADKRQRTTLTGLRLVLRLHLAASAIAALMVTAFALPAPGWPIALVVAVAFVKPLLAFGAWLREHYLHYRGDREDWVRARVLAELCRGAVATWPLPLQPLDANDEEDFPKVKRLIRSLRLLREQDTAAAVRGTAHPAEETQPEADMRVACDDYIKHRLLNQAKYYHGQLRKAKGQANRWRMGFIVATWIAIIFGVTLALNKIPWGSGHFLPDVAKPWLEAFVIIAPFVAAHCLGMMTILDCRRRENRYEEMRHYLTRLAETLEKTQANPSRIRLIEHAERMMIEEQHEWFSVMRNLSV